MSRNKLKEKILYSKAYWKKLCFFLIFTHTYFICFLDVLTVHVTVCMVYVCYYNDTFVYNMKKISHQLQP